MPNWCENSITITGTKTQIKKIKQKLEEIKKDSDPCVFTTLVGAPDENENDEGGFDTVQSFANFWGTKWDVCVDDCSFKFEEKKISMYPPTAWSPPIQFGIKLSEKYGVDLIMIYSEPGINFAGKATIKKGKLVSDEEYDYMEGLYFFDNEYFWNVIISDLEYILEEEGELNKEEVIKKYPYLNKKGKKELEKIIDTF